MQNIGKIPYRILIFLFVVLSIYFLNSPKKPVDSLLDIESMLTNGSGFVIGLLTVYIFREKK
ncbi:hypothetical protein [Emticicia sp. SJ17W-69]|uniref:hypothetical protein n=1 Tax=Emticicia sp. SJ17W-69 TaxID=3421657 RepID=UPI003EB8DD25